MKIVAVEGQARSELGKKATKAVRNAGLIPCVLYGGDEAIHFTTTETEVKDIIFTPDFHAAEISINGEKHRCILKDIQWHPVTEQILHIDFLKMTTGVPIKVELPVRFTGTSPGVKNGGRLIKNIRKVKVKALPENLVDQLLLDISSMEMGDAIRIRDLQQIKDLEILDPPSRTVATVQVPRALKTTTVAEEEAGIPEGEEGAETAEEGGMESAPPEE